VTVTVTATGDGTLSYVHLGGDATFSGTGSAVTLTPTSVGGPFNFAVLVTNGCETAVRSYSISTVARAYRMWVSTTRHNAAIGTVADADTICEEDANLPTGVTTAKALLVAGT